MNLKYSGLIFVLIVIFDAISGSATNVQTSSASHAEDLHTPEVPEKSQVEHVPSVTAKTVDPTTTELMAVEGKTTTKSTTPSPAPVPGPVPPTPTPVPAPERGSWIISNNKTNVTCIIAEMAMQLNITYPANEKLQNALLNIPKNATASGNCSDPSQAITISWGPGHSLRINFSMNKTANNFYVNALDVNVNATVLKDAKVEKNNSIWHFENRSSEFLTPLQMSYKCNKEQDLNLNGNYSKTKAVLSLKDTQFQAYMNKTKPDFGAAQDCDAFDTPDIVPIAVGCALTILVLVVLVAYLIGRRRSQNRGYLSM